MGRIVAIGAEVQAASSLALAYPERDVLFVSDQKVIDGWDLANVRVRHSTPQAWRTIVDSGDTVVPLTARWLPDQDWSLSRTLPIAARTIGEEHVVTPAQRPADAGMWVAKGNRWRRPDMPVEGPGNEIADLEDPHGCGLVFQRQLTVTGTVMTIGRFGSNGASFGVFRVFEERFFRDVILQAAETVADSPVIERSLAIATALGVEGFCTLNWVLADGGVRLTSIRPVPRAAFVTFRRGGIDLCASPSGTSLLEPGLRLNAQPHYASYTPLAP